MQQILAFTRKEFQTWAQRPGSWILVFVLPLVLIWIMQAVFGSSAAPVVSVYAVDEDQSAASAKVMEALQNAQNIKIEVLETREEANQQVSDGRRLAAIIVPRGFSLAAASSDGAKIEIMLDPARSEQASIIDGLVSDALARVIIDAEVTRGIENSIADGLDALPTSTPPAGTSQPPKGQPTPAPNPVQKFLSAAVKGVVSSEVDDALANPQVAIDAQPLAEADNRQARQPSLLDSLVPGYSLTFVFLLISSIATAVIAERQTGTLQRLLVSPVPRSRILLGKMLPYFLIAVAQMVFILLASKLIFGIDLGNSVLALAIIILASALAMAALGILIATFVRSASQASGLAIVLVVAMAVVGGAVFPSVSIPGIQALTPHYWAMQGFVNTIARGLGEQGVLLPAGVLLTMSAVFFTIGAIRFRFE